MNEIKLQKGIPIARKNTPIRPVGMGSKYQLHTYEVGDSAFYPISMSGSNKLASAISRYSSRNGRAFTVRKLTEKGVAGHRVWRIS